LFNLPSYFSHSKSSKVGKNHKTILKRALRCETWKEVIHLSMSEEFCSCRWTEGILKWFSLHHSEHQKAQKCHKASIIEYERKNMLIDKQLRQEEAREKWRTNEMEALNCWMFHMSKMCPEELKSLEKELTICEVAMIFLK